MHRKCVVATLLLMLLSAFAGAEEKSARPSPPAQAQCKLPGGKSISVAYSSPRAKGRKIFGDLVPYGKVWRAGANEATSLVTDANLAVDGKSVPAGSYTIFTIPNADKWTLIINKKTGEWGIPYKYESQELLRADMNVSSASAPVENFTIELEPNGEGCVLGMSWEQTRASVTLATAK